MNILSFLKPKKNKVPVNHLNASLDRHSRIATEILVRLRDIGVEEKNELEIDYFFYSDTVEKTQILETEMKNKDFIVNSGTASHDKSLFVVSGRTTKIKMMHESLNKWLAEMCELGHKHDCTFDSWKIVSK